MSFATLEEVFAERHTISKRHARGAGLVFRGVSTHMRVLEFGNRE